jgi:hypothetical protein
MKPARISIYYPFSYVIDLDNPEMIKEAESMLLENVRSVAALDLVEFDIEEDATLTEDDVNDYLMEVFGSTNGEENNESN